MEIKSPEINARKIKILHYAKNGVMQKILERIISLKGVDQSPSVHIYQDEYFVLTIYDAGGWIIDIPETLKKNVFEKHACSKGYNGVQMVNVEDWEWIDRLEALYFSCDYFTERKKQYVKAFKDTGAYRIIE